MMPFAIQRDMDPATLGDCMSLAWSPPVVCRFNAQVSRPKASELLLLSTREHRG